MNQLAEFIPSTISSDAVSQLPEFHPMHRAFFKKIHYRRLIMVIVIVCILDLFKVIVDFVPW